jgi:hypothetical protein
MSAIGSIFAARPDSSRPTGGPSLVAKVLLPSDELVTAWITHMGLDATQLKAVSQSMIHVDPSICGT